MTDQERKPFPWEEYGGSFVYPASHRSTVPTACCKKMDPIHDGDCSSGCCEDWHCQSCGTVWRWEAPD